MAVQPLATLSLRTGPHRRICCPVTIDAPEGVAPGAYALVDVTSGATLPAQVVPAADGPPRLIAVLDDVPPESERQYRLMPAPAGEGAGVALKDDGEAVTVEVDGELFTRYHYGRSVIRPYLYPVIGPFSAALTRHFPMADVPGERRDHPHHRSIWFTHGDVNGVDNWSEHPSHGYTRHRRFAVPPTGGPIAGLFHSESVWTDAEERPILTQQLELTFYRLPPLYRLIDVRLTFQADRGPVVFGDTKEGGLVSVRVASSMDAAGEGRIENGVGAVGEPETWGKRAPWCDYSGPVQTPYGRHEVGIAIFDHPGNVRYPTPWHVRAYGLMTANCFGLRAFSGDEAADGAFR
ncbi:MAG TPA: PmoA family protein, partial [Limnochordia bacterium]